MQEEGVMVLWNLECPICAHFNEGNWVQFGLSTKREKRSYVVYMCSKRSFICTDREAYTMTFDVPEGMVGQGTTSIREWFH